MDLSVGSPKTFIEQASLLNPGGHKSPGKSTHRNSTLKNPPDKLNHGALWQKEMSNKIGPTVKQLWNYAMHVLHKFFGFNINTTAFCLGQSSLHLLLLMSSMIEHSVLILCYGLWPAGWIDLTCSSNFMHWSMVSISMFLRTYTYYCLYGTSCRRWCFQFYRKIGI